MRRVASQMKEGGLKAPIPLLFFRTHQTFELGKINGCFYTGTGATYTDKTMLGYTFHFIIDRGSEPCHGKTGKRSFECLEGLNIFTLADSLNIFVIAEYIFCRGLIIFGHGALISECACYNIVCHGLHTAGV